MNKLFKILLVFLFTISFYAYGEQALLKQQDIQEIMKQIFAQHVDKKALTTTILKHSFKVYIDQFDPNRTYLLKSEVDPYLNISDEKIEDFMKLYEKNQFPEYKDLNDLIQKSILRARSIRKSREAGPIETLFSKQDRVQGNEGDSWGDPDLKKPFALNEVELKKRMNNELTNFIANEQQRYGIPYVAERKQQTLRLFNQHLESLENQYLFLNEDGMSMNEKQKENAYALHILKSLAASLDAHTSVLNPTEAFDMKARLEKEMDGVGLSIEPTKEGFRISQVLKNGPADKNGLIKVNDLLIEIEGKNTQTLSFEKITEMLKGDKGTTLTLTVKRNEKEGNKIKVTLKREDIPVNEDRVISNFIAVEGGIVGMIKLDSFYQGDNGITAENDVREAIKKLDSKGNLRGLIFDLRENSGGFLSQAIKVTGLFISNGVVVISKYFNGEEHVYRDIDGQIVFNSPLIILTSKATASAAEIVAQSLQDYGVAVVVGDEHTYGKGSIQSQTVTDNQAATFFKVTVGKYYTVSGKTPQIQGVKANIVVPGVFLHENMGEEYLDYPLTPDVIAASYEDNLSDVEGDQKAWYMRYYTPTVQHKKDFWDNAMPSLKKNSQDRLAENEVYQNYIKGKVSLKYQAVDEMQTAEVLAVMKDMIQSQELLRGHSIDYQTKLKEPKEPNRLILEK